MGEEDTTDAQWAQIENEERHRKVAEDFKEWLEEQNPQWFQHRRKRDGTSQGHDPK